MRSPSPLPWSPDSWRALPLAQDFPYPDPAALAPVLGNLQALPPLVFPGEVETLRRRLADAQAGKRFVLQGGDCAERFADCRESTIANKFKILLQMSVVLTYGLRRPVVKIGRLAGQYGKPRSKPVEQGPDGPVCSYFGDNVNGFALPERQPDPARLEQAYFHAAATLNYLRALLSGGFADLHHPHTWDLEAIRPSPRAASYQALVERIGEAVAFMESFGGVRSEELGSTEFFVSHEGLHLPFEQAMVRSHSGRHYATSAHFLWIGERTRQLDGAHVEFFRGVANPVGVKLGPGSDAAAVVDLCRTLNPEREAGRLVLIARMGSDAAGRVLPALVDGLVRDAMPVLWVSDPMHGNTESTAGGRKTRHFDRILAELELSSRVLAEAGQRLGGVHLELTGEDVTECLGGPADLGPADLERRYETWCDPRLNYAQSLEIAFRLNEILGVGVLDQSKR